MNPSILTPNARTTIRLTLADYCDHIGLPYVPTQAVIDTANALRTQGDSVAAAIEAGRKTADAIKRKLAALPRFRPTSPEAA